MNKSILRLRCIAMVAFLLHLGGCGQSVPRDPAALGHYLEDPANGLLLQQDQGSWHANLKYLPNTYLSHLNGSISSTKPTSSAPTAPAVAVFKLRLSSRDQQVSVPQLLQDSAPLLTLDQQQNMLFYHLDESCYLVVGKCKIKPIAAHVEMSSQREQYLDVVFTFPLAPAQLQQADQVTFTLADAFFLTSPLHFIFSGAHLRAVAA